MARWFTEKHVDAGRYGQGKGSRNVPVTILRPFISKYKVFLKKKNRRRKAFEVELEVD